MSLLLKKCGAVCGRMTLRHSTLFCTGMVMCITGLATAQTNVSAPPLTIINPDSPEFDDILAARFPGITRLEGFDAVEPFLILLRNDSGHAVYEYSIRFSFDGKTGGYRVPSYVRFMYRQNVVLPSVDDGARPFGPNEIRLIGPGYINESPLEYARDYHWLTDCFLRLSSGKPDRLIHYALSDVTVDSVIEDNGNFFGPDNDDMYDKYMTLRTVELTESRAVLSLIATGKSLGELETSLEADISIGAKQDLSPSGNLAIVNQRRLLEGLREQAEIYLFIARKEGVPAVRRHARHVYRSRRLAITPVQQ